MARPLSVHSVVSVGIGAGKGHFGRAIEASSARCPSVRSCNLTEYGR